jgi:hypothetical protein
MHAPPSGSSRRGVHPAHSSLGTTDATPNTSGPFAMGDASGRHPRARRSSSSSCGLGSWLQTATAVTTAFHVVS